MHYTHEDVSAENQVKIFVPSKMTKCLELRKKIITLHKQGLSNAAIGKRLLEPKTTLPNIVRHFKTTLNELSPETIRATCASAPKRLEAMVKNEGGYIK